MGHYLVYDIEIERAITQGKRTRGIRYCQGWKDHSAMGISTICAMDDLGRAYVCTGRDAYAQWEKLLGMFEVFVGFNNINFDNQVLYATWGSNSVPRDSVDIFDMMIKNAKLHPDYDGFRGYGLDATCLANGLPGKIGHGALAPIDYQEGLMSSLLTYCLDDCWKTRQLYELYLNGKLVDPKTKQLVEKRDYYNGDYDD